MAYDPLFADGWYDDAPIDELRKEIQNIYLLLSGGDSSSSGGGGSGSGNAWDFGTFSSPSPFDVDFGSLTSPGSTSVDFGSL